MITPPRPYFEGNGVTLYHGDMFDILPHLKNIGALITDPPYSSGGAFRGDRAQATSVKYVHTGTQAYRPEFAGDNRDQRSFFIWMALWMNGVRQVSVPGAPIVCFTDWRQLATVTDAMQVAGYVHRGTAVWSKKFGRPTAGRFSSACEFAPWGSLGAMDQREEYPPGVFNSELDPEHYLAEAFEAASPAGDRKIHIAQKPLEVMKWLCRIVPPGATVLDPFMGSGTTLVAAQELGLPSIGIECDEANVEAAARRLSQQSLPI
jgi:site-specific DNA-methyltransferase (adenine-specific)